MRYEEHVTVVTEDIEELEEVAIDLDAKVHTIVLDRGENKKQVMLTKRFKSSSNNYDDVKTIARRFAMEISKYGHRPIRVKLEGDLFEGDPIGPIKYCESHMLFKLSVYKDYEKQLKVLREGFDAHLSRNPKKVANSNEDVNYRYLTFRDDTVEGIWRKIEGIWALLCTDYFSDLLNTLHKRHNEFVIMDTNLNIDKGWLYASGRNREEV